MLDFRGGYIIEYENDFHIQGIKMSRNDKYNTKQRERILATIKAQTTDFSAKEIYENLNEEIGLTTIYRSIENLVQEGLVLKIGLKDNAVKYQYVKPCDGADHFYLRCEKCGKLEHVDCMKARGLTEHILSRHHFKLTTKHIIIDGLCAECAA